MTTSFQTVHRSQGCSQDLLTLGPVYMCCIRPEQADRSLTARSFGHCLLYAFALREGPKCSDSMRSESVAKRRLPKRAISPVRYMARCVRKRTSSLAPRSTPFVQGE